MKAVRANPWRGVRGYFSGVSIAVAMACGGVAHAELEYGLEAGVGYSDNIERTSVNETDETIVLGGVDLAWLERRRRLDADVRLDLNYNEYLDLGESELTGVADGTLLFGLVPERLTWLVQDSFGQAQQDPTAASTPTNRENINYFTTGPNLIFRLGSAAALRLLGRYSMTTYEDSPLDSERTSGGFVLSRDVSERSSLALNGVVEEVDFDAPESTDFDRKIASVSYTLNASRTQIIAEVGHSWIERDTAVDADDSGALVRLEIVRQVSASSSLNLTAGSQLTDASESLRGGLGGIETGRGGGGGGGGGGGSVGGGGAGGGSVTASADIFENRFASLGWQFTRPRTSMGLEFAWEDDEYETQPELGRERLIYSANLGRQFGRTLNGRLGAAYTTEDFQTANNDELRLQAALSWRFGRAVGLTLTGERLDRQSNDAVGDSVENRVFLTVFYRPSQQAPQ